MYMISGGYEGERKPPAATKIPLLQQREECNTDRKNQHREVLVLSCFQFLLARWFCCTCSRVGAAGIGDFVDLRHLDRGVAARGSARTTRGARCGARRTGSSRIRHRSGYGNFLPDVLSELRRI